MQPFSKTTQQRVLERYSSTHSRAVVARAQLKRAFDRELGALLPAEKDVAILEVGCGSGGLLEYLRACGYGDLSGFDLSAANVAQCHALGLSFVERDDLLDLAARPVGKRYDLIFAYDVIEHVDKARAAEALDALRRRLKPGGRLLLRTPNMGYLLASFHRYGDLTHEFGVTEHSVVDLLLAADFEPGAIDVRQVCEATTLVGFLREAYLMTLHRLVALVEGRRRPRVATKNLLAIGRVPSERP